MGLHFIIFVVAWNYIFFSHRDVATSFTLLLCEIWFPQEGTENWRRTQEEFESIIPAALSCNASTEELLSLKRCSAYLADCLGAPHDLGPQGEGAHYSKYQQFCKHLEFSWTCRQNSDWKSERAARVIYPLPQWVASRVSISGFSAEHWPIRKRIPNVIVWSNKAMTLRAEACLIPVIVLTGRNVQYSRLVSTRAVSLTCPSVRQNTPQHELFSV